MKAIFSEKNNKLVLELVSGENKKSLIEDDTVHKRLNEISEVLGFKNEQKMAKNALKGDESIFEFERVYDSEAPISFEVLEGYLKSLEVDEDLTGELKEEIKSNYLSDLAASAMECVFDNFVYTIFDQLGQLMVNELEIDAKSFENGIFDRMIEIIGMNAGIAQIKLTMMDNN